MSKSSLCVQEKKNLKDFERKNKCNIIVVKLSIYM